MRRGKTAGKTRLRILAWVLGGAAVLSLVMYLGCAVTFAHMLRYRERPAYSLYLRHEDVAEQYERELLQFPSGENLLQGYLYGRENSRGLVVVCHGFGSCADGYFPEVRYFVDQGYQVFSFDYTGCDRSQGENMVSLTHPVLDLDAALSFLEGQERFRELPLLLYGHSWGGYTVTAVLSLDHRVAGSVSVAGFDRPMDVINDWSWDWVGPLTVPLNPFLWLCHWGRSGSDWAMSAMEGINSGDTPVLLIHGTADDSVDYDGSAIVAHREQITNPNVQLCIMDTAPQNDHNHLTRSADATAYHQQKKDELEALTEAAGGELSEEDTVRFYATVDRERSSALNQPLMEQILSFYDHAIALAEGREQ